MVSRLCKLGFDRLTVILEEDPLEIKNLIAQSFGVVTSRLHGLYNALNAAVPPVVIPWNFKYQEALKLYSCESQLVDTDDAERSIIRAIDNMFCAAERAKIRRACKTAAPYLENASENMWNLVKRAALSQLNY
jgi:colanic acid/amylovoran biosynthesis protein